MSGLKEIQCELPQKPWKDFSSVEIRRYCLGNLKSTDCSFIAKDEKDNKAAKVYRSFKWLLSYMSPVLKEILNDKENQAKNCKEIVVPNAKIIEAILIYGHLKVVNTRNIDLLDFYEAAKEYEVKALEDEVIQMFNSAEKQKNVDWVKLFWLSYVKYPKDQQMRAVFEKVKAHLTWEDTFVDANFNLILEFDQVLYDIFFDILLSRTLNRFKITEAYLIKHFFEGNKDKKLEEIDPFERNIVEWYIDKMDIGNRYNWPNYTTEPLLSNLLTAKHKIEHLEVIKKRNTDQTILNEIELCIQKLREGESKLETENKP